VDLVEVDALQIAYERAGSGPALVLLHGYVGDGPTTWRRQLDELSDEFTVVANRRGSRGQVPLLVVDDVRDAVRDPEDGDVDACVWSMSGASVTCVTAAAAAVVARARRPERPLGRPPAAARAAIDEAEARLDGAVA
jgi:pimeloyl-ACP methyl ester carboxylesterase